MIDTSTVSFPVGSLGEEVFGGEIYGQMFVAYLAGDLIRIAMVMASLYNLYCSK